MSVSNPPFKHHYIPRFLLAPWALDNGKLWSFVSPMKGKVAKKPVSPKGVGYKPDLYATSGVPEEKRQWLEEDFLSPLDSNAANAHRMLLCGTIDDMPERERSAWSRFIISQWFRTPVSLQHFKDAAGNVFEARRELLEARYAEIRTKGSHETLAESIDALGPDAMARMTMELFREMTDDPGMVLQLNNMQWSVIDVAAGGDLLLSDAMLQHSPAAAFTRNGYLRMPIAPDRLFVATNRSEITRALHGLPAEALVRQNNDAVVRRAEEFVGAIDLTRETFIKENFGVERTGSYIQNLADVYRADAKPKPS